MTTRFIFKENNRDGSKKHFECRKPNEKARACRDTAGRDVSKGFGLNPG